METIKKKINGKDKSYTLRTPLSAWDIVQSDDPSTPSTGSGTVENGGSGSSAGSETEVHNGSGIIPTPTDPEDDQPGD